MCPEGECDDEIEAPARDDCEPEVIIPSGEIRVVTFDVLGFGPIAVKTYGTIIPYAVRELTKAEFRNPVYKGRCKCGAMIFELLEIFTYIDDCGVERITSRRRHVLICKECPGDEATTTYSDEPPSQYDPEVWDFPNDPNPGDLEDESDRNPGLPDPYGIPKGIYTIYGGMIYGINELPPDEYNNAIRSGKWIKETEFDRLVRAGLAGKKNARSPTHHLNTPFSSYKVWTGWVYHDIEIYRDVPGIDGEVVFDRTTGWYDWSVDGVTYKSKDPDRVTANADPNYDPMFDPDYWDDPGWGAPHESPSSDGWSDVGTGLP